MWREGFSQDPLRNAGEGISKPPCASIPHTLQLLWREADRDTEIGDITQLTAAPWPEVTELSLLCNNIVSAAVQFSM